MTIQKEFATKAIKEGFYTGEICEGWDWIRENLSKLDDIFQSEEYKNCNGMKYKCLPLLVGDNDLTDLEKEVLSTAWYCNNKRVRKLKNDEKVKKFNDDGFFKITDIQNKDLSGKKIQFIIDNSDEMFGGINKYKGKLVYSPADDVLFAMKGKATRKGFSLSNITPDIYIKFI
jgi:hypothetical protein